jgi:hypothetical protein
MDDARTTHSSRTRRARSTRHDDAVRNDPPVSGWRCPSCERVFGRAAQSHDCAPGLTVEEYFSTGPEHERPVFDAVMRHLATVGPVHADVVSVGIFLKNPRKFAELRPMQRWVAVSFSLRRRATHRTITRKVVEYGGRYWHVANVERPEDVDDELCALLTEAYEVAAR